MPFLCRYFMLTCCIDGTDSRVVVLRPHTTSVIKNMRLPFLLLNSQIHHPALKSAFVLLVCFYKLRNEELLSVVI